MFLHDFGEPVRRKFQRKCVESVKKRIRTQEVVRRPFLTRLRGLLGTPFGTHLGSLFRPFEKRRATKQERKKNTQKKSAASRRDHDPDRLPPPDHPPVAHAYYHKRNVQRVEALPVIRRPLSQDNVSVVAARPSSVVGWSLLLLTPLGSLLVLR